MTVDSDFHNRVATRAYFLSHKEKSQSPLDDWLRAEREEVQLAHERACAAAAAAGSATFHFQRLLIEIPAHSRWLFNADDTLNWDSPWAPYLVHELVHYVQCMSTVLGQSILMNWFAVAIGAAQALYGTQPLRLPLHRAPAASGERRADEELREYFSEVNSLVGAGLPLRASTEAAAHAEMSLYDYQWTHPRGGATNQVALSMREAQQFGAGAFGVPLLGDAFNEGMARIAQRLCSGDDIDNGLVPIERRGTIYYTALYRLVRSRFPSANAALLTIVLCDAALCSRTPGRTFAAALRWLDSRAMPASNSDHFELRAELDSVLNLQDSRSFILNEIDQAEEGIPEAHQFGELYKRLIGIFRAAWSARQINPAVFVDASYREDFLQRVITNLGTPPVVFEDRDHVRRLGSDDQLERACHAFRGTYDVLVSLTLPQASECTLLRSKACVAHKVHACRNNVLSVPIPADGKACAMVFAAHQLALHRRGVVWS